MTIEQLRQCIISHLSKGNLHSPYFTIGNNVYTRQDIIDSLNAHGPLGDDIIDKLIGLIIDLLDKESK